MKKTIFIIMAIILIALLGMLWMNNSAPVAVDKAPPREGAVE